MEAHLLNAPAVIIGEGITALGTLRALHKHNVKTFLDCPSDDMASYSRYYRHLNFLSENRKKINFDAIAKLPYDKIVLIPCADMYVTQVQEMPDKYRDRLLIATCSIEALTTLVDKAKFANQIEQTGIQAPVTKLIKGIEDFDQLPASAFEDAFLKPLDSQSFHRAFGVKAVRVDSAEDAKQKFKKIADANCQVVLQKYIPGPAYNHYFVDGFCDRHGEVKATFARRRLRIYPIDFGNSCFMRSVPKSEVKNAISDLETLLKSINYRGIFSAEFKLDENDGQLKIIEVNARAWWYVGFAAACGINTPWLAYQDALSQEIQPINDYPVGARCVYPYSDFNAYRYGLEPKISFIQLIRNWIGAKQPVFCWADPWPATVEVFGLLKMFIQKKLSGAEN